MMRVVMGVLMEMTTMGLLLLEDETIIISVVIFLNVPIYTTHIFSFLVPIASVVSGSKTSRFVS